MDGDEYIKISSDSVNIEYGRLNELKKKTYFAITSNGIDKVEFFDEDGNPFSLNSGEYKEVIITAISEGVSYGICFGKIINVDSTVSIYHNSGDIEFIQCEDLDAFGGDNTVAIIEDTQKLFCIGNYETDIYWKATVINYIRWMN